MHTELPWLRGPQGWLLGSCFITSKTRRGSEGGMRKVQSSVMRFTEVFGGAWIPVKFHREVPEGKAEKLRFCEALSAARFRKVLLTPDSISCPGASRSMGWGEDSRVNLYQKLGKKLSLSPEKVGIVVDLSPILPKGSLAVEMAGDCTPEMIISFAQPTVALLVARAVERDMRGPLRPCLATTFSICGNVAVRRMLTGEISITMGSPDARASAGIGRDQLVIGVPWSRVGELLAAAMR